MSRGSNRGKYWILPLSPVYKEQEPKSESSTAFPLAPNRGVVKPLRMNLCNPSRRAQASENNNGSRICKVRLLYFGFYIASNQQWFEALQGKITS